MLAASRPIRDLYGESWQVLAPAGALLFAIAVASLLGSSLARRARAVSVLGPLDRRIVLTIGIVSLVITAPLFFWPSRLAAEVAYAQEFDAERAVSATASFNERAQRVSWMSASASVLGTAPRGRGEAVRVVMERVEIGDSVGGVSLAHFDNSVIGTLVLADPNPRFLASAGALRDQVLMFVRPEPERFPIFVAAIAGVRPRALIAAHSRCSDFPRGSATYPLPTYCIPEAAIGRSLGRALPAGQATGRRAEPLGVVVSLRTQVELVETVVHTRSVPGLAGSDRVVYLLVPVDEEVNGASDGLGIGLAAAAADLLGARPLPIDVRIAVAEQVQASAATRSLVDLLEEHDRARLSAVIIIARATEGASLWVEEPGREFSGPPAAARVGARVAEAVDIPLLPYPQPEVLHALRTRGVSAPMLGLTVREGELSRAGRSLMVLLSYLAWHPETLR
jgi:hypothetical protein